MNVALGKSLPEAWLNRAIIKESWDYIDSDTQGLTHSLHRYSGKFIPQIAARVINMLSKPGDFVLDPYCGSGTVLVEAALAGRRALGIDLNPLAVLIAQTKVSPVSRTVLNSLRQLMREAVDRLEPDDVRSLFVALPEAASNLSGMAQDVRRSDPWFSKWFQPEVLHDLFAIEREIQKIDDRRVRNIALTAFSDILRKSSNAHSGYPNVMFDKDAPEKARPGRAFLRTLDRVCSMVESLSAVSANWNDVRAKLGTATATELPENSVDLIVTHPPYIGSIPYAEYGSLSLKWLGVDPKSLDRELTGGKRQSRDVVLRFREAYGKMLVESHRVLCSGGHAFLMVGNPVVRGNIVDLAEMTVDLAHAAGFTLAARTERRAINRRANKMGGEHLLFFQKNAGIAAKALRSVKRQPAA
jgi:hypothetical protein